MEMVLRAALVARGAMGTQDRPTIFQINKAKIRLLAQLAGGATVLVCISVHDSLPAATGSLQAGLMPNAAQEFQVNPCVPTKSPGGRPRLEPAPTRGKRRQMLQMDPLLAPCPPTPKKPRLQQLFPAPLTFPRARAMLELPRGWGTASPGTLRENSSSGKTGIQFRK